MDVKFLPLKISQAWPRFQYVKFESIPRVSWHSRLKRQCYQIFDFRFFHESVSPKPLRIPFRPFRIFSKIRGDIRSSRCTTGVVDIDVKWKKISFRKVLIIFLGHLWLVELTYREIFSFKFPLRCHQSDIDCICHRCRWHRWQICRRCRWYQWQFATSVIDTGGKFAASIVDTSGKFATDINNTNGTGGKICRRCRCLYLRISLRIFEKIPNDPNSIFGGLGEHDSW